MTLESNVDVLVIGAGPAGVSCANALAMAGVNVRIIDKRSKKVMTGHADGIQTRTIEVFQSYGLAERLIRESNQLNTFAFYNTGPNGGIESTARVFNVPPPSARYPFQITVHQGITESIFLDSMKEHGVEVERLKQPSAVDISEDIDALSNPSSYPVKVTLSHLDENGEKIDSEVVHAKFVVGADGANSWVRKTLGIEMEGEPTDFVWGVLDMVIDTDFPDVRNISVIHSTIGTCLYIPRERDLARFYLQLSDTVLVDPSTGKVETSRITPDKLLSLARNIFRPYKLPDPKEIDWWTVYSIKQRVASSYSFKERILIIGDACHTHSAKAGQGMNAGINDSHNLAWKLAQVLRGWSSLSLLKTYEDERRKFAQELINFDKNLASRMSRKPKAENSENNSNHEGFLRASQEFVSGIGISYGPSVIVNPKNQQCAEKLVIGKRMLPHVFLCFADTRPVEIQDMLVSDVRFKVLCFVGNLTDARVAELEALAEKLDGPCGVFGRYTVDGNTSDAFGITTITADKKGEASYVTLPPFFSPHWSKVLLDDIGVKEREGNGYEKYGIDPKQITFVVVRPDGYVGAIAPSTALEDLDEYFGAFMIRRSPDIFNGDGVESVV